MASKACCTIPPIIPTNTYTTLGTYTTLSGMRTYVSGSPASTTGILIIYDIFGLDFPQTLQGVDIISSSTSTLAIVPDLFHGSPMPISNYPPDTPEKSAALRAFFSGPAAPPKTVAAIKELLPVMKETYPGVQKWGLVGYCWGGKIVALLSGEGTEFVASAQIHPAMLDPEDGGRIVVPHFCLATRDEDKDVVEAFKARVQGKEGVVGEKSLVMRWEGTFHGFMAARADLEDKENLEYYEKGYKKLVHWLKEVL
ncbi:hypothetical protein BDD12DRAFT_917176 [Trichophaea hybrida]|nr:hypothetical protein BDD12DRAFT_917176 [Trichophaea hybrida]